MSVTARFRIRRDDFELAADFMAPGSGVTGIFGASGAGKTTLLRAIAGLETDRSGFLQVGDEVWQDGASILPTHRRPVGYVFQEASLFTHLTVRGNLEYAYKRGKTRGGNEGNGRGVPIDAAAEWLGIGPLLQRDPASLSGGERQRVAIARSLLAAPRLMLMDEPLASLDVTNKAAILPLLERVCAELDIPVLYVSHAPDEVARLADHLVLLESGRVRESGPVAEMLTRTDLSLSHRDDAESMIEASVVRHDDNWQLTILGFVGGEFSVPRRDLQPGQRVRLRLLARDVSLTLARQTDTSILNIFPARVEEVVPGSASQVLVRLDVGGESILSRITRKSADALGIAPGREVYVQAKSVALLA